MKTLRRDIIFTLLLKLTLLILLWFVCFKNAEKTTKSNTEWLLGEALHAPQQYSSLNDSEVLNDTRQ